MTFILQVTYARVHPDGGTHCPSETYKSLIEAFILTEGRSR